MKEDIIKDKFDYEETNDNNPETGGNETSGYSNKKIVNKKQGDGLEEFSNDSREDQKITETK